MSLCVLIMSHGGRQKKTCGNICIAYIQRQWAMREILRMPSEFICNSSTAHTLSERVTEYNLLFIWMTAQLTHTHTHMTDVIYMLIVSLPFSWHCLMWNQRHAEFNNNNEKKWKREMWCDVCLSYSIQQSVSAQSEPSHTFTSVRVFGMRSLSARRISCSLFISLYLFVIEIVMEKLFIRRWLLVVGIVLFKCVYDVIDVGSPTAFDKPKWDIFRRRHHHHLDISSSHRCHDSSTHNSLAPHFHLRLRWTWLCDLVCVWLYLLIIIIVTESLKGKNR